jgi:hypothetical protein
MRDLSGRSLGVGQISAYCTTPSLSITKAALLLTPCISNEGNVSYKTSMTFGSFFIEIAEQRKIQVLFGFVF